MLLRLVLLSGLLFSTACGISRAQPPMEPEQQQARTPAGVDTRSTGLLPVLISPLPGDRLRLSFPAPPTHSGMEKLSVKEIRPLLAAFGSFRPPAHPRLRLMLESPGAAGLTQGPASPWELRLREEFLSQYGPALLPVPDSLESSRLSVALKLSTRYMDGGIREAAQELFSAPAFLARADRNAIHELFSLDGTLVRRFVPRGMSFP